MKGDITPDWAETTVLSDAKDVFEKMRESAQRFNFNVGQTELYRKALKIEEQSRDFYLEKADEVDNPDQKEIFKRLADEEQKHFTIVQNICDFVSKPQSFLENAEFHHMEDYVEGVF